MILAQRALILFFFFPFYDTVKLNLLGKWVTKHNFYHFEYRALFLYVKPGGYFCSWDGERGREGGKEENNYIDLH